jgi:hypothetical protein
MSEIMGRQSRRGQGLRREPGDPYHPAVNPNPAQAGSDAVKLDELIALGELGKVHDAKIEALYVKLALAETLYVKTATRLERDALELAQQKRDEYSTPYAGTKKVAKLAHRLALAEQNARDVFAAVISGELRP